MIDPLLDHFRTLARYNTLANLKLYERCAQLSDAEYKKPRKAFFASIMGTLNHLMVGDRIWLARFAGEEVPSTELDETDSVSHLHVAVTLLAGNRGRPSGMRRPVLVREWTRGEQTGRTDHTEGPPWG